MQDSKWLKHILFTFFSVGESPKKTSSISHLVKKRKKSENEEEEGASEAKKAHIENGNGTVAESNGHDNKTNGSSN